MRRSFIVLGVSIGYFFVVLSVFCTQVFAQDSLQEKVRVDILPFAVHAKETYFVSTLPTLLQTRMSDAQISIAVLQEKHDPLTLLKNDTAIAYVLQGTLTSVGEQYSLDVTLVGRDDFAESFTITATEDTLLEKLTVMAQQIRTVILDHREKVRAALTQKQDTVLSDNFWKSNSIHRNAQEKGWKIAQSAWTRTESFQAEAKGLAVGDLDADGVPEIVVLGTNVLIIFHWNDGKLQEVARHTFMPRLSAVSVRIADVGIGTPVILVTTFLDVRSPYSAILTYKDGKLQVRKQGINYVFGTYYDAVTNTTLPILQYVTQYPTSIFASPIRTWYLEKDVIVPGKVIELPNNATVFNFTTLRTNKNTTAYLVYNASEMVQYYENKKSCLYTSGAQYSGSMNYIPLIPAWVLARSSLEQQYEYIPLPMTHLRLPTGEDFILLSQPKNRSSVYTTFRSYTGYTVKGLYFGPETEEVVWESPPITDSVYGYVVYDINNDGSMELLVLAGKSYVNALTASKKTVYMLSVPLY